MTTNHYTDFTNAEKYAKDHAAQLLNNQMMNDLSVDKSFIIHIFI